VPSVPGAGRRMARRRSARIGSTRQRPPRLKPAWAWLGWMDRHTSGGTVEALIVGARTQLLAGIIQSR